MGYSARKLFFFIKTELYEIFARTGIPILFVKYKLRWESRKCQSLEEYVDLVFKFNSRFPFRKLNIRPLQVKQEILELLKILIEMRPKIVLEIGTANGGTLFLLSRVAAPKAKIISVDLPGGPFGGGYPEWRIPLYRSFARDGQEIHFIRANSHSPDTVRQVDKILVNRKVDFIFVDGDHTYEGVKEDFETYAPYVKNFGIVAFHDIIENSFDEIWQVHRFWEEIKQEYKHKEIISEIRTFDRISGIGVLYIENHARAHRTFSR